MKRLFIKVISVWLLIIVLSFCGLPVLAESNNTVGELKEPIKIFDKIEEKEYCNATIDEDFSDDSVLVVLKNNASLKFKEYTKSDFDIDNVSSVKNLTSYTFEDRKQQYAAFKEKVSVMRSNAEINSDFQAETNSNIVVSDRIIESELMEESTKFSKYHQILKLNLKSKSKQSVLDAVKQLEQRDDVLAACPNYIPKPDTVPICLTDGQPKEHPTVNGTILMVMKQVGILRGNNQSVIQNIITEIRQQLLKHLQ